MNRLRVLQSGSSMAALGVGLALSLTLPGAALASNVAHHPPRPTPPAAQGTVSALGSGSFTLKTPSGSSDTVDYTSATAIRHGPAPLGTTSGTVSLAVGDQVQVFGSQSGSTVQATSIQLMPAAPTPPAPAGKG